MTLDPAAESLMVAAVGLVVGWGSTLSGLGVGLSMPVLALLGVSLPQAWLAVKLPVAAADLAAAVGEARAGKATGASTADAALLPLIAAAGAVATAAVLQLSPVALAVLLPSAATLAALGRMRSRRPGAGTAIAWGAYVGGCGVAAGLLWRLAGRAGVSGADGDGGVRWRAAANLGAVATLLAWGQGVDATVVLLAAAQAAGAWIASRPFTRRRHGLAGRSGLTPSPRRGLRAR